MIRAINGKGVGMAEAGRAPVGSARLELVHGVPLLHPEDAVLEAMLTGWANQLRGGRRLAQSTIAGYRVPVTRFLRFTDEYPWRWTAAQLDEWMAGLVADPAVHKETIRAYQTGIRDFCTYLISPHYEWPAECEERFGTHPVQICHEWNTVAHLAGYEGDPARRPLTREECQRLFNYADEQVERAVRSGRKGAAQAYRDATVFKVLYGWGLRIRECAKLDLNDFYCNPAAPELAQFGQLHVRWGKASKGSPPRRRMVPSVMPWAVAALEDYVTNIRPRQGFADQPAVFVTERGGRLRTREIQQRFADYGQVLGMPAELTPHCLRHSWVTHLIEDGADPKFVQEAAGHRFGSTTGIYTAVSGDYMNTRMRDVLDRALHRDKGTPPMTADRVAESRRVDREGS